MNWKDHLKPEEVCELFSLSVAKVEITRQRRRIYDRCRKRMAKENGK